MNVQKFQEHIKRCNLSDQTIVEIFNLKDDKGKTVLQRDRDIENHLLSWIRDPEEKQNLAGDNRNYSLIFRKQFSQESAKSSHDLNTAAKQPSFSTTMSSKHVAKKRVTFTHDTKK